MSQSAANLRFVLSAILCLSAASAAHAGSLYLDFGNLTSEPSSSYGAVLQPGTWNKVGRGLTNGLLDSSGGTTTTSVTLTADFLSGGNGCPVSDTCKLRHDNFVASPGDTWAITFNNLDNGTYSLYYYAATNTNVSSGAFTANTVSAASILGSADATLVQGSDWDVISVSVTNGTLSLVSTSDGYNGLSGLQLSADAPTSAPEPAGLLLVGPALAALWLVNRRTQAKPVAEK